MNEQFDMILANNIRNLRKKFNLTQTDLAERLGYTEKSVSKWERGFTPPLQVVMAIADIFNVSLNDLTGATSKAEFYLGIDGGGTKTKFALADKSGRIIKSVTLGPSNPFDVGMDECFQVLREGIESVCTVPYRKVSVFAGMAGGSSGDSRSKIHNFLSTFGFARFENGSDSQNIIQAGLGYEDGVIVIMGTGSSAFIQKSGDISRIGGYGYLIDRGGCGYDIGIDGLKAAMMEEDGSGEKTKIYEYIYNELGYSPLKNLQLVYKLGKVGIAALAKCVFKAYKMGDEIAKNILLKNMDSVAFLIHSAAKIGGTKNVILYGGLLNEIDVLLPMIKRQLSKTDDPESFVIMPLVTDSVTGAIKLAQKGDNNDA